MKKGDKIECFNCTGANGVFGPGAIEDLQSLAAGGKPWHKCHFCDGKGFITIKFNKGDKVIFKGPYDNLKQTGVIYYIGQTCYYVSNYKNEGIDEVFFDCYIEPLKEPNDIMKNLL